MKCIFFAQMPLSGIIQNFAYFLLQFLRAIGENSNNENEFSPKADAFQKVKIIFKLALTANKQSGSFEWLPLVVLRRE